MQAVRLGTAKKSRSADVATVAAKREPSRDGRYLTADRVL